jgi:hypothetical protein
MVMIDGEVPNRWLKALRMAKAALVIATLTVACIDAPPPEMTSKKSDPKAPTGGADSALATNGTIRTTTGLPCAVSQTLSKNCQTCHGATPKTGASAPLVTWDDLQKPLNGNKVFELVKDRIHSEAAQMPPAGRLPAADIKVIDDWIAGGAKSSTDTCDVGSGPPPATRPFVCNAPATTSVLKSPTPFKWTDASKTDQYMCFGIDEQLRSKRHVITLGPRVDNLDMVHHMLLFQVPESFPTEPQPCSSLLSGSWKMITGWAPGGTDIELPPEAGYPEEGNAHWVIQVHYNNASGKNMGAVDNSGFQICSTDQLRPNDAATVAFGSHRFSIPPRTAAYTITCDYELTDDYAGVTFFSGRPHMHKLGTGLSTQRIPSGTGPPEMLVERKPFSFENQSPTKIERKVAPKDIIRTSCTWKNTGDSEVTFGENTSDEMCFTFVTYYPAIPDRSIGPLPIQTWITPALVEMPILGPQCREGT